jgi:outer membrane protein assembly factor BamB
MITGTYRRHRRGLRLILGITLLTAGAITHLRADDWPEWRGKGRLGVWNETGLVDRLPATLPVTWRTPINRGYSGPAVAGGHVFVTDARRARTVGDQVVERLVVLDESTGKILWTKEWETDYSPMVDVWAIGPVATPTVDGDHGGWCAKASCSTLQATECRTREVPGRWPRPNRQPPGPR